MRHDHNKVESSAHLYRRPSAAMLLLSCDDDDDDDDDEVVRDGPEKGGEEKSTSSSSSDQPPDHPPSQHPGQTPNERLTQSFPPAQPSGSSNTQGEEVGKHPPQFPDYSYQITRKRLMPFEQCSGSHELAGGSHMKVHHAVVRCNSMALQDWESSENVDEHNHRSSSRQFCIAQPESCPSRSQTLSNSQSDEPDSQYFKSPAQSQGSSSVQPSECFTVSHILEFL